MPILAEAGLMEFVAGLFSFKLVSCLALSAAIFSIGAMGVIARRNVLVMLISVEVMLNAVMLAFVSFARAMVNLGPAAGKTFAAEGGQIFALFIIAVAAAEAAVGLAIVIAYFRNRQTVDTRDIKAMRN
jgi:NADH-quinone oxidoreductase subunit K